MRDLAYPKQEIYKGSHIQAHYSEIYENQRESLKNTERKTLYSKAGKLPEPLTCLLRNLYADQEATVRSGHGITDWFQIGKGVCQGSILSPSLFNLYAGCIMQNPSLDEAQASRLLGEISITSDTQMTPPLWQKVKN